MPAPAVVAMRWLAPSSTISRLSERRGSNCPDSPSGPSRRTAESRLIGDQLVSREFVGVGGRTVALQVLRRSAQDARVGGQLARHPGAEVYATGSGDNVLSVIRSYGATAID